MLLMIARGAIGDSARYSSLSNTGTAVQVALQNSLFAYRALVNTSGSTSEYRVPITAVLDTGSYDFTVLPWSNDSATYSDGSNTGTDECDNAYPVLIVDMSPAYYNSNISQGMGYSSAQDAALLNTSAAFWADFDGSGSTDTLSVAAVGTSGNTSYVQACSYHAGNLYMHDWTYQTPANTDTGAEGGWSNNNASTGLLGLGYCTRPGDSINSTVVPDKCLFQQWLNSIVDSSSEEPVWVFGLDLHINMTATNALASASVLAAMPPADAALAQSTDPVPVATSSTTATTVTPSTLQLGGIHSTYTDTIVSYRQPVASSSLSMHVVMLKALELLCSAHVSGVPAGSYDGQISDVGTSDGAVSLFSNFSATYPAIVDTGSVGLTLPGEFFDTLVAWLNLTSSNGSNSNEGAAGLQSVEEFATELPVLRFRLSNPMPDLSSGGSTGDDVNATNQFYLPLANLLMSSIAFANQTLNLSTLSDGPWAHRVETPPSVLLYDAASNTTQSYVLAVLRGSNIHSSSHSTYNTPSLVLGTLVLQSVYFAANMRTGEVGLANKYYRVLYGDAEAAAEAAAGVAPHFSADALRSLLLNGGKCAAPTDCGYLPSANGAGSATGSRTLLYSSNTCSPPSCRLYFFNVESDTGDGTCHVHAEYYAAGVTLLVLFALMDALSYFASEYTAKQLGCHGSGGKEAQYAPAPPRALPHNTSRVVAAAAAARGNETEQFYFGGSNRDGNQHEEVPTTETDTPSPAALRRNAGWLRGRIVRRLLHMRHWVAAYVEHPIVLWAGWASAAVVDFIVVRVLQWTPPPTRATASGSRRRGGPQQVPVSVRSDGYEAGLVGRNGTEQHAHDRATDL